MAYIYVDDGSAVPVDMEVFKDRHGFLEDKDGRKITNTTETAGITNPQSPSPMMELLEKMDKKLDDLLKR